MRNSEFGCEMSKGRDAQYNGQIVLRTMRVLQEAKTILSPVSLEAAESAEEKSQETGIRSQETGVRNQEPGT
jgi:hypothetical protein